MRAKSRFSIRYGTGLKTKWGTQDDGVNQDIGAIAVAFYFCHYGIDRARVLQGQSPAKSVSEQFIGEIT
jgi:hypothetical protein